jgi:hypothetical protein
MKISVELEQPTAAPAEVRYAWDADTDILSAWLTSNAQGSGMSGSVGLEGNDGSWLILDVAAGQIASVEVAVWPRVRHVAALAPPAIVQDAQVTVPSRRSQPNVASLEMDTTLTADADPARRNFHFRLGKARLTRTVRLGRDLLLDVDDRSHITGLWLLNVPPCPAES